MPPKRSITLTEAELRLMKILWSRGESAVGDLVAAMPDNAPLAYNSVLTTVRILEQKGYVLHRQEGRAYLYSPCIAEHEASRSEVRQDPEDEAFTGSVRDPSSREKRMTQLDRRSLLTGAAAATGADEILL